MLKRVLAALLVLLVVGCDLAQNSSSSGSSSGGQGSGTPGVLGQLTPPGGNSGSGSGQVVSNPGGGLPNLASKPQPQAADYQGCPAGGDGGDKQLNALKNRTDSAPWYPVSLSSILALTWPKGVERAPRFQWSQADAAAIARYEGTPVQVEGYLAGAKQQGPESCNCHSVDDVDNHLWLTASPTQDRSQSVVVEITPRVRAMHPGWVFARVQPLAATHAKVRISGWLLMDQEHPDQVGKTRGTIWEIHPIIAIDVMSGSSWVSLNTGRVSTTTTVGGSGADVQPTEDPSLPPPITDPYTGLDMPTATALPPQKHGGRTMSSGAVRISDIAYNGQKGSSEPDEYVEIVNSGSSPVNMDGWALHDIYGGQEFTWHNFTIQPGQTVRVYTNEVHPESGGFSFGSSQAIWANKGDAGELIDSSGTVVSTFAYGNKR